MLSPIVGSATSEMCYSLGHVKVMSIFLWQSESLSWGGLSEEIETEKAEPTYSLTIKCLPRDDEKGKEKERSKPTSIKFGCPWLITSLVPCAYVAAVWNLVVCL